MLSVRWGVFDATDFGLECRLLPSRTLVETVVIFFACGCEPFSSRSDRASFRRFVASCNSLSTLYSSSEMTYSLRPLRRARMHLSNVRSSLRNRKSLKNVMQVYRNSLKLSLYSRMRLLISAFPLCAIFLRSFSAISIFCSPLLPRPPSSWLASGLCRSSPMNML